SNVWVVSEFIRNRRRGREPYRSHAACIRAIVRHGQRRAEKNLPPVRAGETGKTRRRDTRAAGAHQGVARGELARGHGRETETRSLQLLKRRRFMKKCLAEL